MGSDRQSILLHENGKKHKEKLKELLKKRQQDKLQQERQKTELEKSLLKMEQIANMKSTEDSKFFGGFPSSNNNVCIPLPPMTAKSASVTTSTVAKVVLSNNKNASDSSNYGHKRNSTKDKLLSKQEMESWNERKKRRIQDKSGTEEGANDDMGNSSGKKKPRTLGQNDGHYYIDEKIYLEGGLLANTLNSSSLFSAFSADYLYPSFVNIQGTFIFLYLRKTCQFNYGQVLQKPILLI